jgi:hypothetical protein
MPSLSRRCSVLAFAPTTLNLAFILTQLHGKNI